MFNIWCLLGFSRSPNINQALGQPRYSILDRRLACALICSSFIGALNRCQPPPENRKNHPRNRAFRTHSSHTGGHPRSVAHGLGSGLASFIITITRHYHINRESTTHTSSSQEYVNPRNISCIFGDRILFTGVNLAACEVNSSSKHFGSLGSLTSG
jgi:hypothetical protein